MILVGQSNREEAWVMVEIYKTIHNGNFAFQEYELMCGIVGLTGRN